MPTELIKQLLEAGVHFGHKTSRWNPKMKKYIFGERSNTYIIDLEKTEESMNKARDFLMDIASKGETVLFVGTKKQAQEAVQQAALRCGMFYVTQRWPGGLLTNFTTVKRSISRLKEIEKMKENGTFEKLPKKEVIGLEKEKEKLKKSFSGIVAMEKIPKALFIVDTNKEETAVREARRLSIPVVALIDTNSNPDLIDFPIPGNDDAIKSIRLVSDLIAEAIGQGRKKFLSYLSQEGVSLKAHDKPASDTLEAVVETEEAVEVTEGEPEIEVDADQGDKKPARKKKVTSRKSPKEKE